MAQLREYMYITCRCYREKKKKTQEICPYLTPEKTVFSDVLEASPPKIRNAFSICRIFVNS